MLMKHPTGSEPVDVHPSQVENMKRRGYVEVPAKPKTEKK